MAKKIARKVTLLGLPFGFMDNLPQEDQRALLAAVGSQVKFNGYDERRAELELETMRGLGISFTSTRSSTSTGDDDPW
jgi:hypothetical protein